MKTFFKKLFVLSGLLPATFLLGLTFLIMPDFIKNLSFDFEDIGIALSMIFGICGYIGLLLSLLTTFENKNQVKLIFLVLGIIGSILFTSIAGSERAWAWVINIEEFDEWIIWVWLLIVSIILAIRNGQKLFRKNEG